MILLLFFVPKLHLAYKIRVYIKQANCGFNILSRERILYGSERFF